MSSVITQAGGAVAAVNDDDLARYAGMGTEGASTNDYAVPFLHILQRLSPQVDEAGSGYVSGAKPGNIFETTTSECFDGKAGIVVIPCAFKKDMVEWKTRESGGGFVAAHGWNEELLLSAKRNEKGQFVLPSGNIIVETKYHYVLFNDTRTLRPAVLSLTSTQLKRSRKWLSLISMRKLTTSTGQIYTPPSFAFTYKLHTVPESNDRGNWFSWNIEPGPQVADPYQLREAIKFHKAVMAGEAKLVDASPALDDDIPF